MELPAGVPVADHCAESRATESFTYAHNRRTGPARAHDNANADGEVERLQLDHRVVATIGHGERLSTGVVERVGSEPIPVASSLR